MVRLSLPRHRENLAEDQPCPLGWIKESLVGEGLVGRLIGSRAGPKQPHTTAHPPPWVPGAALGRPTHPAS